MRFTKSTRKGLGENDQRVYLVAASIIATLGIPDKVPSLEKSELKSSLEEGNTDGDIIVRKIRAFLNERTCRMRKAAHHPHIGEYISRPTTSTVRRTGRAS